MRETTYVDPEGRKWRVVLPDEAPEEHASMGVRLGPPTLASLGLPLDLEVRLHNALYDRALYQEKDVLQRRTEVFSALLATFRLDVETIVRLYKEATYG